MFVLGGDEILNSFVDLCSLGNFGWKYSQSLEEHVACWRQQMLIYWKVSLCSMCNIAVASVN